MNKTIQVSLAKQVFHVDDNAYIVLKNYTDNLHNRFANEQGADDILFDIEARIAELLLAKKNNKQNEAVTLIEINEVLQQIGSMDQYETEPKQSNTEHNYSSQNHLNDKKFYRDTNDKILGGVLSGAAHYFGLKEVLWLRLFFALVFVIGFQSGYFTILLFAYILLWVIIPPAINTLDRMRMKGNPITVDEIEKNFKKEYNELSDRLNNGTIKNKFIGFFGQITTSILWAIFSIFKVVGSIIGVFVVFLLIVLFMGLNKFSFLGFNLGEMVGPENKIWAAITYWGLFALIAIPLIALLITIIKTLFKWKFDNRIVTASGVLLWIVGFFMTLLGLSKIGNLFDEKAKVEQRQALYNTASDTLYVGYDKPDENFNMTWKFGQLQVNGAEFIYSDIDFDIKPSPSDSAYFVFKKSAYGSTIENAKAEANGIEYTVLQNDTLLTLNPIFKVNNPKQYRGQKIVATLMLPVGKSVYLKKNLEHIANDIDNTTETYDDDMLGKTWTMTPNGLSNREAELEKLNKKSKKNKDEKEDKNKTTNIKINGENIRIENDDNKEKTLLIVNDDTIKISTK